MGIHEQSAVLRCDVQNKHFPMAEVAKLFRERRLANGSVDIEYLAREQCFPQSLDVRSNICSDMGGEPCNGVKHTLQESLLDAMQVTIFAARYIAGQRDMVVLLLKEWHSRGGRHGCFECLLQRGSGRGQERVRKLAIRRKCGIAMLQELVGGVVENATA